MQTVIKVNISRSFLFSVCAFLCYTVLFCLIGDSFRLSIDRPFSVL